MIQTHRVSWIANSYATNGEFLAVRYCEQSSFRRNGIILKMIAILLRWQVVHEITCERHLGEPHSKALSNGLLGKRRKSNMRTHAQIVEALMQRPGVRAEVERISREESDLLDSLLKARQDAGLSHADVAERMGIQAPAIARLERALATGKHSPSVATLRKYAKACGKRLVLQVA